MRKTRPRTITFGAEARSRLIDGASSLARVTSVTYGPHGQTVLLDRAMGILATKDGVTVAREVFLPDPVASMGCQALKDACIRVNNETGDGTTTTAVLTAALLNEGRKLVEAGVDPVGLTKGLKEAAECVIPILMDLASPVESQNVLERVASVASNGDEEIASKLAEAAMAVGKDGVLSIEDGYSTGIELVFAEGMEIDRGWATPVFSSEAEVTLEGPLVAVVRGNLITAQDVETLLYEASGFQPRPLIVFAEWFGTEAISTFYLNRGVVRPMLIQTPGVGHMKNEWAKDIAALSNATYVDHAAGYDHRRFQSAWLGALRRAKITTQASVLVSYEDHDATDRRILELRAQEHQASSDYFRDQIRKRIAKLSGGMAVLRVGGVTEVALKERRGRLEDAQGAVRAALRSGVLPGAGTAYLEASEVLKGLTLVQVSDPYSLGFRLLARSLEAPLRTLARNAGVEPGSVIQKVKEARAQDETGWVGWDALTDTIRDLGTTPMVLDPAEVVEAAIRAAVSTASTLLLVEVAIA